MLAKRMVPCAALVLLVGGASRVEGDLDAFALYTGCQPIDLIVPNDEAIVRLVRAILIEQNDEWAVARRYLTLETVAGLGDPDAVTPPAIAAA